MKKIIFLLIAVLGISGVAFGQKEVKLLWERQDSYFDNGTPYTLLEITPSGKTIVTVLSGFTGSFAGNRIFDTMGKDITSSILRSFFILNRGKTINWASTKDSLYLFDKELSLIKVVKHNMTASFLTTELADGIIFYSEKEVFKYNFKGEILWRYTSNEKIVGIANKRITVFKLEGGDYIYLDNYGKVKTKMPVKGINGLGFSGTDMFVFKSADAGFWFIGSKEFYKFDSTGTQTGYVDFVKEKIESFPYFSFKGSIVTNDIYESPSNFIVAVHSITGGGISFIKIDSFGKYQIANFKDDNFPTSYEPYTHLIDNDRVMFRTSSYFGERFIGVSNFKEPSKSWIKQIPISDDLYEFVDSTFVILNNKSKEPITDRNKYSGVTFYDLNGKIVSTFKEENTNYPLTVNRNNYPFTGNNKGYLYINNGLFYSKIRANDGAVIWRKDKPIGSSDYDHSFMSDSEGNDYWIYSKEYGVETKIDFISKSTNKISRFFTYPKLYYPLRSNILIDSKSKTLLTITNGENNNYGGHVLRKYSTRCLYDLEATAQAMGNTEVCSGTKVKLSTTKQDGLTYQWQKDGKDIPTFKDVVHDVEESGNYTVTVKDEACQNQAVSNPIPVTIKPTPEAKITTDVKTVIYEPFTVKMTANTGTGLSYQWLKDDVIIPNETSNIYEAKKSGKYNVSVTKDGCVKTSEALNISIQIALSAESEINEETVQIYPNPSRGEFKLILPKSMQDAEIQLFDLLGRERILTYTGEQARAEGLVQGTYFLKVTKGEKSVTNKIVVE
jgi:Secretion system C-terminal sorting domain